MKKIFLLFAAVGVFFACDPVHEKIDNGGHITVDELKAMSTVIVDKVAPVAGQKTYISHNAHLKDKAYEFGIRIILAQHIQAVGEKAVDILCGLVFRAHGEYYL